jgi:hypothetical protein
MSVYVLLYQSRAARPLKVRDLLAIYSAALRNNPQQDITGLLTYAESDPYTENAPPDQFMQWLEGPREEVEALFGHICEDSRHERVRVLCEGFATAIHGHDLRIFPNWAMGIDMSETLPAGVEDFFRYLAQKGLALNYRPSFGESAPEVPPESPRYADAPAERTETR